jgi:putative effector of murein hydrolase LrgA (UPF0299 family)
MDEYLQSAVAYAQANPVPAGLIGLVLLYLLLRQTKTLLYLITLAAVLGAVFYLIADLGGKGRISKSRLVDSTLKQDVR